MGYTTFVRRCIACGMEKLVTQDLGARRAPWTCRGCKVGWYTVYSSPLPREGQAPSRQEYIDSFQLIFDGPSNLTTVRVSAMKLLTSSGPESPKFRIVQIFKGKDIGRELKGLELLVELGKE